MSISEINDLQNNHKEIHQQKVYTVKQGDTLFSVANSLGISVNDLKKANNLKSDALSLNQKLIIPVKSEPKRIFTPQKTIDKGFSMYKEISDEELKNNRFIKVIKHTAHTVVEGDNPATLGRQYNVLTASILMANNMNEKSVLTIGKKINIPPTLKAQNIKNLKDLSEATGMSIKYLQKLVELEEMHSTAYKDKNGNYTIGIGHFIKDDEIDKYKNKKLSETEIYTLLAQDMINREENIKYIIGLDAYKKMPKAVKDSVMDFVFSRGEDVFKKNKTMTDALKKGDYKQAISKMNVDYSYIKFSSPENLTAYLNQYKDKRMFSVEKDGVTLKKFLSGLSKRRLFEMSHASSIYKDNIPEEVLNSAQNVYNNGLYIMQLEKNNGFISEQAYPNVKAEYNELIKNQFKGKIILK